ncbi:hypothetical protein Hdeb2414_s0002g00081201 [Helianthus debilis subsp. tardiflorus]
MTPTATHLWPLSFVACPGNTIVTPHTETLDLAPLLQWESVFPVIRLGRGRFIAMPGVVGHRAGPEQSQMGIDSGSKTYKGLNFF